MDIVSALERKYGYVKIEGDEAIIDCPFCGDNGLNLQVNIGDREGAWHCWVCGESGSTRNLDDKLLEGMPVDRGAVKRVKREKKTWDPSLLPGECVGVCHGRFSCEREYIAYWFQRRFGDAAWERMREAEEYFDAQLCVNPHRKADGSPAFAGGTFDTFHSIVVPVYENGECIGWQARRTIDTEIDGTPKAGPKYYTSYGLEKGDHLYNIDNASKGNLVVVTEGVWDCINVGLSAVSTFGCNASREQANLLKARWDCIVILYDPDEAGRKGAKKLAGMLAPRAGGRRKMVRVDLKGYKGVDLSKYTIAGQP